MSEIDRLQKLAGIVSEGDGEPGVDYRSDTGEGEAKKAAIGHIDNERGMISKELYLIGRNAMDVHKMLKDLPDSDFPHWWQAKIVKAHEYLEGAKIARPQYTTLQSIISDDLTKERLRLL